MSVAWGETKAVPDRGKAVRWRHLAWFCQDGLAPLPLVIHPVFPLWSTWTAWSQGGYLVDPASSHMLVSKIKPCMSKYKQLYSETANGSLNQL
jgi:hypothetical protein